MIVLHTHRYHPLQSEANLKHHNRLLLFPHCQCSLDAWCLLLAASLLAAKPGSSTLDTKKGYKTKTGSTSSVPKFLTPTLSVALTVTMIITAKSICCVSLLRRAPSFCP